MDIQMEQQQRSFLELILSFFNTLNAHAKKVWMYRKQLFIVNGIILVLTTLILFFVIKPYFQSKIFIMPDYGNKSSDLLSQFSGLASLAGVNVNDNSSTLLYQTIITSETVMSDAIYQQYHTKAYKDPVNLIQYFALEPDESLPDSVQKRKLFLKMYKILTKELIEADYDRQTKILMVMAEMPESELSAEVANSLVVSLDKYVRTQRKSYATEQRKYLEARVKQVKDTLTNCEESLKRFREKNRQILQSPEQQLEQARLVRNFEIQQAIYSELIKQLELIKLQEIKDTPVVNVCEYAKEPVLKFGPPRVLIIICTLLCSFILSSGWILSRNKIRRGWMQLRAGSKALGDS